MRKVILYLWQLPQNILGLLVILVTRAKREGDVWFTKAFRFGVSLGSYVIFGGSYTDTAVRHEKGHQKQSQWLGWLYLILIGIPSVTGNIIDRLFHRKWSSTRRTNWYYNLPWEKQADSLGGVCRAYDQDGRYVRY